MADVIPVASPRKSIKKVNKSEVFVPETMEVKSDTKNVHICTFGVLPHRIHQKIILVTKKGGTIIYFIEGRSLLRQQKA